MDKRQVKLPNGDIICYYHMAGRRPGFLVAGGYGTRGPADKPLGIRLAGYCRARERECVILEYRGQGDSSGPRHHMTVPSMRDDILAVAEALGVRGWIGVGASLGSWAMLSAQEQRPDMLWGMVALAPAIDWDLHYFSARVADKTLRPAAEGLLGVEGETFLVSMDFFRTANEARIAPGRIRLAGGMHVLHGGADAIASPRAAADLAVALASSCDTTLHFLPEIDHSLAVLQPPEAQKRFLLTCEQMLSNHEEAEAAVGAVA